MDFSKFSDDNFNMTDWINGALQPQVDANLPIDAHASSLVMKLQLFIQEVTKSLEETSHIALNNVPRVLREVETIQAEAKSLKTQMMSIKSDIEKIEENTAQSMKRLIEVNRVKTQMENTENALQEAGNWSDLRKKVDAHFESGDLKQVAEGLVGMQKSLLVLRHVPDYSERCTIFENLKNKYEAAISPTLVKTFKEQNLENAKYFVEVFTSLDRLLQLERYYNKCHKSTLALVWNDIREDPNKSITLWLPVFFDHLVNLWHTEATWCAQIFPDPVQALCSLLIQILSSIHPSIESCLNDAVHDLKEPNDVLALLIDVQDSSKKLITSLEKAVQQFEGGTTSLSHLITTIHAPFQVYLLQYTNLQQAALLNFVDTLEFESDDLMESASAMTESALNAFKEADLAVDTCIKFTNGAGVAGLIEALQVFFSAYFGLLDQTILELHTKFENHAGRCTNSKWTNFQHAFKIIEMCGILSENMKKFKDSVVKHFMKTKEELSAIPNYLKDARPTEWDEVMEFNDRITQYQTQVVLPSSTTDIHQLTKHAHHFAFHIIFAHLKEKLESINELEIWSKSGEQAIDGDLPTFSLSPQAYITYVGDSLLTLPEQLEPYFTQENHFLIAALKEGQIPYQKEDSIGAQYHHHWLESFVHGTAEIFAENILKIKRLTNFSTRQLLADLDYYFNILAALEISPTNELDIIRQLLEIQPSQFHEKAEELSALPDLIKSISKMRNVSL